MVVGQLRLNQIHLWAELSCLSKLGTAVDLAGFAILSVGDKLPALTPTSHLTIAFTVFVGVNRRHMLLLFFVYVVLALILLYSVSLRAQSSVELVCIGHICALKRGHLVGVDLCPTLVVEAHLLDAACVE